MNVASPKILGVIIAGGLSRRFGSGNKIWAELAGEPMIARAARRLAGQTGRVVLNVNTADERLERLGYPVAPDLSKDSQGPLAGLLAVMHWARSHALEVTHIVTAPADSPFFPDDLTARLLAGVEDADEIAIAACDGIPQPVFGLWPLSCFGPLKAFLTEAGSLKVMDFVRSRNGRCVDFEAGEPPAFFNINTYEDYQTALALMNERAIRQ